MHGWCDCHLGPANCYYSSICRYNISTGDYEAWDDSEISGELQRQNARVYNGAANGGTANRQISNVTDIYEQFGMDFEEGARVRRVRGA